MMGAIRALWVREVVRFFRQKNRVIGAFLTPVLFWAIMGAGFNEFKFMFSGGLVMIVLFTGIFSAISVIQDRKEGFLQGVLVSPAPRVAIALGKILGGTTIAMIQVCLFLGLGWLVGIVPTVTAVGALALISLGMVGFGFAAAWRMESVQGFHAIMNLVLMPMWILSGAWFDVPEASVQGGRMVLRYVMLANPLTYGVSTLRHTLGETGNFSPLPLALGVTVGFAILMILVSGTLAGYRPRGGTA